ncbi:MAG: ATP-binding cassette domain-containing protein, partial [Bdellovibrionota bacterium]
LPGTAAPLGQPVGWDLRNIRFSYPEASKPIFENFNLQIRPGETLVIQGPSGGGKSTLVNLLLGNLRPQSGAIHVRLGDSEVPIDEFRSRLLPEVGYVGPECFLIEGTIYKNITYGLQREPEPAEVEQALRLAECQFVSESPEGLNKQITEQGQGLSAGQKQRLSLARALLRRPKALFLDEATSNLDHETEKRLLATLSNLKGHATMIVVTHRPSLLQLADQELRLE